MAQGQSRLVRVTIYLSSKVLNACREKGLKYELGLFNINKGTLNSSEC